MDWCVDSRVAGATDRLRGEIHDHLERHSGDPALVEMARPLIDEALGHLPPRPVWVELECRDGREHLHLRRLPDRGTAAREGKAATTGELPGLPVVPGLSRAHEIADGLRAKGEPVVASVELSVGRTAEADLDPGPGELSGADPAQPAHILGLISSQLREGQSLSEAAARAGATLAEHIAREGVPGDAGAVARMFLEAERVLGGDFHSVRTDGRRAVIRNRRCPFGPATDRPMCRFTSALAGGLAARGAGSAHVEVSESLAAGDHQCLVAIDLDPAETPPSSHRYHHPPAPAPPPPAGPGSPASRGFQITLSMQLPRDRVSVPITRHLIGSAMAETGVCSDDREAVELAVTEACANVIDHSGPGDAYDISVAIGADACHIRVVDLGRGFDHRALSEPVMADGHAEHGRGVALMHALVDQVRFESEPESGTVVHLVKLLHFDDGALGPRLLQAGGGAAEPPPFVNND